ncbi:lipoate--protein ligase [[Eubacterium] cellulosolvens]
MAWRLLDLGAVDGFTMTNLYEAVAKAINEKDFSNTVILSYPDEPFVNVGFHQIVEKEVNLDFVREHQIPIVRRSIGGGTILDGPWEQDYFFIVNKKSNECPPDIKEFYRLYLTVVALALKRLGVPAEYKPINDIVVRDRKISGNGGISIGDTMVLAGDILLDLPTNLMTNILRVPDEKFRDKLKKSLSEWMTSLKLEMEKTPTREEFKSNLIDEFKKQFRIKIEEEEISNDEKDYLSELLTERKQREWIFVKDMAHKRLLQTTNRHIKIREGVSIYEGAYKSQKLIRITMEIVEDRITDISISGDFFTEPYIGAIEKLEQSLFGVTLDKGALTEKLQKSFRTLDLKIFGANIDDFANAILTAKENV